MDEITEQPTALVERVAALDIGKAALTACVRVPHEDKPGARRQEVRTYATVTPALLELRDWLTCQGVTLVVMEATSAYWKPPFYLLEDAIACQVVNACDVKNVPGRPKTDKLDAVWLGKLAALIGGQTNPHDLARLARGSMRAKTSALQQALTGHFTEHHAFLLGMMLDRIDALTAQIHTLTTAIEQAIAPLAAQAAQLDEIPGIGVTAAQDLLAEIG